MTLVFDVKQECVCSLKYFKVLYAPQVKRAVKASCVIKMQTNFALLFLQYL